MKTIEIECSRTVHYSTNVEMNDEQAAEFQKALESGNKQEVQHALDQWIDSKYDVIDVEEFDILNVMIDDERVAVN